MVSYETESSTRQDNKRNHILNKQTLSESDLTNIDKPIINYLFYKIWVYKGKLIGIHNDFGRLSFLNIIIPINYYCSQEEQAEIILELISIVSSLTSPIQA